MQPKIFLRSWASLQQSSVWSHIRYQGRPQMSASEKQSFLPVFWHLTPPSDLWIMFQCDLMSSTIDSVYFYFFLAGEKTLFWVQDCLLPTWWTSGSLDQPAEGWRSRVCAKQQTLSFSSYLNYWWQVCHWASNAWSYYGSGREELCFRARHTTYWSQRWRCPCPAENPWCWAGRALHLRKPYGMCALVVGTVGALRSQALRVFIHSLIY